MLVGIPARIDQYGGFFLLIPRHSGQLPDMPFLGHGPLSAELASVHNPKADHAVIFADEMDTGITTAGRGLIEIAKDLEEFDRQGANAIARLFPDSAPGTDGAR